MDQDEDVLDSEVNKIYGRCRCCLEPGYVKNMWTEYLNDGAREIYGEMLMETFSVAWESNQDNKEQICDMCVDRLRDAYMFKREVLASEQVLKEGVLDSKSETIKDERASELDQYENTTEYIIEETEYKEEDLEQEVEYEELDTKILEADNEDQEAEYEEVEYLEDEITPEMLVTSNTSTSRGESSKQADRPKRKRIPGLNIRNYRNYTEQALREGIDAALSSNKPLSEVAAQFGVPRKTLTGRLFNLKQKPKPDEPAKASDEPPSQTKTRQPTDPAKYRENIRTILSWSNGTPFNVRGSDYVCCYCEKDFSKPSELKLHTLNHRYKCTDGEVFHLSLKTVRLDITNLKCLVCYKSVKSLENLLNHFKNHEKVYYTDIKNRIIPYKFDTDQFKCAVCDKTFNFFKLLRDHMSDHYKNYECEVCGKASITKNALATHKKLHATEQFSCSICNKMFTAKLRLDAHKRTIHVYSGKSLKCWKCDVFFANVDEKTAHDVESHGGRPREYMCSICQRTFTTRMALKNHTALKHTMTKQQCAYCGKVLANKRGLDRHIEARHSNG